MPRHCSVCGHPERAKIDQLLLGREVSVKKIAELSGIVAQSLLRHRDGVKARKDGERMRPATSSHIVQSIAAVVDAQKIETVERGEGLFDRLKDLEDAAYRILAAAEQADNLNAANGSIGQLRGIFSLYVDISAEQRARGKDDISKNPDFIEYQTLIATVLREFPGSLERLRELEGARRAG